MADERVFDPQPSQETEGVAVQDFGTGSFANSQFSNGSTGQSGPNVNGASLKDVGAQSAPENASKENNPAVKDKPRDESFKVFTPEIPGCLVSDAVLYSVEKAPLKSLITGEKKNEKKISSNEFISQTISLFSGVSVPWSYQDEANRIEKQKEQDFNAKYLPPLPEQVVGRLTIKEESKNWYKIAFDGGEGYVKKEHIDIESLEWLTKSHQKETGDETIKAERKKVIDKKLREQEASQINKEEKTTKGSELKRKIFQFSRLSLKITTEERKLKEAKEVFEKRLKKREKKDKNVDEFFRRSHYTEAIHELTAALKKDIPEYNRLNQWIKSERMNLLSAEEKAIVKEYKLKILDEQEDKKTDDLDPEVITRDIENKALLDEGAFKQYEEGKKQQKIKKLEEELENPTLDDKEKAAKQEEIKKINNPVPGTKPEDFARKEILLYADGTNQTPLGLPEKKALLHYLLKVSELTEEEKRGLFNFMVQFFDDVTEINEVFGYDGDKIDPKAFTEKFSDLEFTMPSDLVRDQLNENKKTYKKERKTRRKASNSLKERRAWRRNLKVDFKKKRKVIKAPRKNLKEQSKENRQKFRADKRKNRKNKRADENYVDKRSTIKSEFKNKRESIREEKRKNPVLLRGLWQKSRKDATYASEKKRLEHLNSHRTENQGVVKMVRDNKSKKLSIDAINAADKQTAAFWGFIEGHPNFYLDAYELESLRRTEGDTEKLQVKSIRFYETYFKGNSKSDFGYQTALFDFDPNIFYRMVVLSGLLFKTFPAKYYQNNVPSRPSEVQDDFLRFFYADDFARFGQKDESLEENNNVKGQIGNVISNVDPAKLDQDWFKFTQQHPGNYLEAYELEQFLKKDGVSDPAKKEKLYAFYLHYDERFKKKGYGFANKEALWAKWNGNPTTFFKDLYPAEYFNDKNELLPPTQVYMDLWDAIKKGGEETLKEYLAEKMLTKYAGDKAGDFGKKNLLPLSLTGVSALVLSDLLSEDSNVFKTSLGELSVLSGYLMAFAPFNKTILDYKRTDNWGDSQSFIQHKLRVSNQPFGDKGISPVYPDPPGRSGEFKLDPNTSANYPGMFEKDEKKTPLNSYAAFQYDFLKNRTENSKLMNQTSVSAGGFGQFFPAMGKKPGGDKKDYSMLAQGFPMIWQNNFDLNTKDETLKTFFTLANLTGQQENQNYLNSTFDKSVFNYGANLSVVHQPSKYLGMNASVNYAGVNAVRGINDLKKMDLWSGQVGIAFNANPVGYLSVNANLNYNWAYTNDLTPNPTANNQDAMNGIGQQHVLSGNVTIGNGFWEFRGSFSDDLMRSNDATSFSLRFSLNQIADIPKGTFSAQVFMDKHAAIASMDIPSLMFGGVKLIFHLKNVLPHQPY